MGKYILVETSKEREEYVEHLTFQTWPRYTRWEKFLCVLFGTKKEIIAEDRKRKLEAPVKLDENWYGLAMFKQENGDLLPVICMHGGSGWLCKNCAKELVEKQILTTK